MERYICDDHRDCSEGEDEEGKNELCPHSYVFKKRVDDTKNYVAKNVPNHLVALLK